MDYHELLLRPTKRPRTEEDDIKNPVSEPDYLDIIPYCILQLIISYFGPKDRMKCLCISKKWNRLCGNEKYWDNTFMLASVSELGGGSLPMEKWLYIKEQLNKSWKWMTQLLICTKKELHFCEYEEHGTKYTNGIGNVTFRGQYYKAPPHGDWRWAEFEKVYLKVDYDEHFSVCFGTLQECTIFNNYVKYDGRVYDWPQFINTVDGYGTKTYRNSSVRYEGAYHNGCLYGLGSMILGNGNEHVTRWSYGYPVDKIKLPAQLKNEKTKWGMSNCAGDGDTSYYGHRHLHCKYCWTHCRGQETDYWERDEKFPMGCECTCRRKKDK